jgi:hypothetical protein
MISENIGENRIRPDDTMIGVPAVRRIFGNVAVSTVYDDADLMALKIIVSGRAARWIEREVLDLRAKRVERSGQRAAAIRAQIEERRERRRAKQRTGTVATTTTA